jgi:hypothetical protein
MAEHADEGESMAEQIPEAWIGQVVTVYFGLEGYRQPGILKSVSERGIVVQSGLDPGARPPGRLLRRTS